jgi:hypothetical protein
MIGGCIANEEGTAISCCYWYLPYPLAYCLYSQNHPAHESITPILQQLRQHFRVISFIEHFYCDTIQCNSTALCLRLITSTSIISISFVETRLHYQGSRNHCMDEPYYAAPCDSQVLESMKRFTTLTNSFYTSFTALSSILPYIQYGIFNLLSDDF